MPLAPVVAQYAGLVPLMAAFVYRPPVPYWLIAGGFGASWIGDAIMLETGGSWRFGYIWIPLQVGLVLFALAKNRRERWVILTALPLVTMLSVLMAQEGPDVTLTVVGSLAIVWRAEGRTAPALYVYFGLGTVLYLLMLGAFQNGNGMPAWFVYQSCRLTAYGCFVRAIRGHSWAT